MVLHEKHMLGLCPSSQVNCVASFVGFGVQGPHNKQAEGGAGPCVICIQALPARGAREPRRGCPDKGTHCPFLVQKKVYKVSAQQRSRQGLVYCPTRESTALHNMASFMSAQALAQLEGSTLRSYSNITFCLDPCCLYISTFVTSPCAGH